MDLGYLERKFKIKNAAVMVKTKELLRLARVKCSTLFRTDQMAVTVCCLELGAKTQGLTVDRDLCVRLSGLGKASKYQMKLNTLSNVLGIRNTLSAQELCVKLGLKSLETAVSDKLREYRSRFLETVPKSRRMYADFSAGVYPAVALYICATQRKVKINREKLLQIANTKEEKFSSTYHSFATLCSDTRGGPKTTKEKEMITKHVDAVEVNGERLSLEDVARNPHISDAVKKEAKEVQDYQNFKAKYMMKKEIVKRKERKRKEHGRPLKRVKQLDLSRMFGRKQSGSSAT
mmetsp:Transcript_4078/g.9593  ORF Transcript_4078/g.9593 Transcript_4078/m.9593 type:complete len:290 (+) Transcript_4078:144-1013(+)